MRWPECTANTADIATSLVPTTLNVHYRCNKGTLSHQIIQLNSIEVNSVCIFWATNTVVGLQPGEKCSSSFRFHMLRLALLQIMSHGCTYHWIICPNVICNSSKNFSWLKALYKTSATNSCFENTCITPIQVLVNGPKLCMSHKEHV